MSNKTFNKRIYEKKYILQAIEDYRDFAEIAMSEDDLYYICEFKNTKYDKTETEREFANYLIELQNARSTLC